LKTVLPIWLRYAMHHSGAFWFVMAMITAVAEPILVSLAVL
jgi:hypothetical protein